MSKILVVFGATGQQGGSVVSHVLNDVELSKEYRIRAISRDATSASAQALQAKGVEVVAADVNDKASLPAALEGAHTVFALTAPTMGPDAMALETLQGKALADAAIAAKAQYLIFSTLPKVSAISGGKYTGVVGFDAKADVETYIRSLPIKSAFFAPGSFMQNFNTFMVPQPNPAVPGTYVIRRHVSPQSKLPLIDTTGDAGKFIGAILAEPEKFEGKVFCAATKTYTLEDMARIIGEKSGKTVVYQQIPEKDFRAAFPPQLAGRAEQLVQMMSYQQDFGYYGPETEELVKWASENARGKPSTFEDYLERCPLPLK